MRTRCNNPNHETYDRYGGRGISICERWNKFENFLEDMGERPEGMTLDRIDNDGDYTPENCRWSGKVQQMRNRSNNVLLTIYGKTMSVAEWHEIVAHEISYEGIRMRLRRGWPHKEAVFGRAAV